MITAFLILVNMKMSYFCGEYCGQLYQEKQYFDLYKVKMENGLARNPYKYERKRKRKIIQAQKLNLTTPFGLILQIIT
jgi:hypothetical protein